MQQGKIDNKLVLMKIILRILNDERRFNKQLRLQDALIILTLLEAKLPRTPTITLDYRKGKRTDKGGED